MNSSIFQEIEEHWRALYAEMHLDPPSRDEFINTLLEGETKARAITTTGLQPHLAIFEFGLEFLAYVHIAISNTNGPGPSSKNWRALWGLTGAAVSFGVSIRSLVLSGLDTPARALLRTYVETLLLCIAILHDHALGDAYAAAETDQEIKDFWHSTASPRKLHERIIAIEKIDRIGKGRY